MKTSKLSAAICLLFASISLLTAAKPAALPERESVWPSVKVMPDAQEHQIAAMTNETSDAKFNPKKHRIAYLEWFEAPAKPNGGCMILIGLILSHFLPRLFSSRRDNAL